VPDHSAGLMHGQKSVPTFRYIPSRAYVPLPSERIFAAACIAPI
jgi:hypothetical protein